MTNETYKFQYEQWHQDTQESKNSDIINSTDFIKMHNLWPEKRDAKIFDVGCGMGRLLLAFRENGYQNLSGIDIDDYQISIAQKESLDVKISDAGRYFHRNKNHYDMITMIDCLEHIEKDKQIALLKSINKSISNDGRLVIRVPNALTPTFAYFRYDDFTHKVSYTVKSLTYILKNAGFEYIVFRPAWQETKEIIKLKEPFARLLKAEFDIDNPILTANIVVVVFKTQKALNEYQKKAPDLEIKYK